MNRVGEEAEYILKMGPGGGVESYTGEQVW
jgi:hypothetical protein